MIDLTAWLPLWWVVLPSGLLWAIVLHEAGHYYYFKWIAKNQTIKLKVWAEDGAFSGSMPKIKLGTAWDYKQLSPAQNIQMYLSGIVLGLVPVFLCWLWFPWYISGTVLLAYAFGCKSDTLNTVASYGMYRQEKKESDE